jgi:hypothetical protein
MRCEACENEDHDNCGMQTWCTCDCEGYEGLPWPLCEHGLAYGSGCPQCQPAVSPER